MMARRVLSQQLRRLGAGRLLTTCAARRGGRSAVRRKQLLRPLPCQCKAPNRAAVCPRTSVQVCARAWAWVG